MTDGRRPTWAEIKLKHIAENVRRLAAFAAPAQLMAVVKADGYGHGGVATARTALAAGAHRLAVACPEEGILLRRAGIAAPILVLGALLPGQETVIAEYRLTATIASPEVLPGLLSWARRTRMTITVHLKVDTGMGRLGLQPEEVPGVVQQLMSRPRLEIEGLYSHFASADTSDLESVDEQVEIFRRVLSECQATGWNPRHIHLANTAGLLQRFDLPECTLVRTGIGIYGLYPSAEVQQPVTLHPAMTLKSRVATVKRVPAGTGVGYGLTYRTKHETTLCTLPIGYADGLDRRLSGRFSVLIRGRRHPIVGRISMDQCVVETGDAPVAIGDEVVLLGRQGDEQISAEEWADCLDTIPYEIVCGIAGRVRRVYDGGRE